MLPEVELLFCHHWEKGRSSGELWEEEAEVPMVKG